MRKDKIRLLIADDDKDTCKILVSFFEMQSNFEICGVAYDGIEALEMIRRFAPDAAIVDIIMPGKDGITVLEELKEYPPLTPTRIVITSAIEQENVMKRTLLLGARFFMIKPYDLDVLLNRILLVVEDTQSADIFLGDTSAKAAAARAVLLLGVPTQLLGYQYIISAVYDLMLSTKPCQISKALYASIALEFGTTDDCVERAIRQALRKAFEYNSEMMQKMIAYGSLDPEKPPSNGRLLTLLATYIKLEGI